MVEPNTTTEKLHTITDDDGNEIDVYCYDSRVTDYCLLVNGKKDGKERTFEIRSPCRHLAEFTKETFYERRGSQSIEDLMKQMGWTDLVLDDIYETLD